MSLIQWDQSYSVKVPEFDEDHRTIFALINKLHEAMSQGCGRAILGGVFDELVDYTMRHFAAEERLLEMHDDYPEIDTHKAAHEKFRQQVVDLRRQYDAGALHISVEVALFLKSWLKNHILTMDKRYGDFLAGRHHPSAEREMESCNP